MRKFLRLLLIATSFLFSNNSFSQSCVPTNLNGTTINLSCGNPCTVIRAQVPHLKSDETYALNNIPYAPLPYIVAVGNEDPLLYDDDFYSVVINLPFTFCFYDSSFNKVVVGSNGLITFDETNAGCDNGYPITTTIPGAASNNQCSQFSAYYPRSAIMAAFSDLYPTISGSPPDMKIQWRVEGNAPCRRFVVSYFKVGTFGADACALVTPNTFQIILYESTGLIDFYIENKSCVATTSGGRGIMGLQNWNRNAAVFHPARNATNWNASNEGWRFTPNGNTSRYVVSELLDLTGAVLATADTSTTVQGLLDIEFPNICPGPGATQYVIRTTFGSCPAGTNMVSLDTITIQRNNTLPVTTTLVQPTCGTNSGTITVNVATGVGTTPYSYSINGGAPQASNTFPNLPAGIYTIFATDATGCDTTYQVTLTAISNLTANVTSANASCPGNNNGSITVVPTSGVAPFSYTLNPTGTTNTTGIFTGLAAGTYTVTFTDANVCTGTTSSITIGPGTAITATAAQTPTSCAGANNGSITITPTSGTAPYSYSLDGGPSQASNIFTGVSSGAHTVLLTDANGCNRTLNITVTTGTGLTGAITSTPASCPGVNDGTVTVTNPFGASPGTPPYTYQLNGGPSQPSNTFTGLAASATPYTVTFTDANGCQGTRSILVNGGTVPSTTATAANTSCAGANDGVIVFQPIAGSTYTVNPGGFTNTTGTFTNLPANTYTLGITTAGGCTGTVTPATITINPGTALSTTSTSSAASCPGVNNGSITVTPVGTGTTTYTLNPGAVTNTTGIFTGLGTGTYTITFVTSAGCTGSVSPNPVVTASAAPTTTATATATSCPGVNDGSVTVTPVGAGTTYTLNPGAVSNTTGVFTGLGAGTYTITFITSAGCNGTVPTNPVVTSGPAPTTTATASATSCPGVNDGSVTVTPVGAGTTYTLNPGAVSNTTGVFTGLGAGTYTITFITAAGCNGTVPTNPLVTTGPAPTSTATATATSCPTVNDGVVTVTPVAAGTVYTLNPGAATNTTGIFTGLAPNTYTVTFVTPSGCNGTVLVNPVVTAGPFRSSTFSKTDPVCANINDGTISITPTAPSAGPYTVTLTGPGGPFSISGNAPVTFTALAPGTYNYSFTDAGGCTGTGGPVTLVTNAPIFSPATFVNPSCNGNSNGSVTFSPFGGVAAYQYSINGGTTYQTSNTFTGLNAGTHNFRIRDNVGCIKDTSITLTQPAVLVATVTGTTAAGCSNDDGTLTASSTGGTTPYTYSIAGPTVNTTGTTSGIFTGLANGVYTLTVTDAQGCIATATTTVALTDNMFLTLGPDVTICAESSVTFDPQTNAQTNIFTWRGINGTATNTIANPNIKNAVASPLDTATYELHAQWGTCERRDTIVVNVLRKPIANAGLDTAICNNTYAILRGSASNLSGNVNYEWQPTNNIEFPTQAVTRVFPASSDTTYTYTLVVRDTYGCNFVVSDQVDVRVQPPVPAYAGNDTTAVKDVPHQLMASGGSNYLWTPSASLNNATLQNPLATLQQDQKFVVRVTDFAGCIGYDTVFVKVYIGPAYYVPNAFTPNGDGLNDVFRPIPVGVVKTEWFRVFNRYGETVFETNQWMKGWDGSFKGKKQPVGAYVWVIKGVDRDGKIIEMKGTVMLVQ